MVFWRYFKDVVKRSSQGDKFQDHLLRKPERFRVGLNEIATIYSLSHWMIREGIVEDSYNKWGSKATQAQRDLNIIWVRQTMKRGLAFILFCYLFGIYYGKPRFDWQDYHDPKFEQKTYGDLEEGGDEGGDDD